MIKLIILLCLASLAVCLTIPRNRVQVQNGTLVSDIGTMLRGGTFEVEHPNDGDTKNAQDNNQWKGIRNRKLNVVRLDIKTKAVGIPVAQQLPTLDSAVNYAEQNGVYVMILTSVNPGTYDKQALLDFWNVVAPRYKNRTHVLYEMTNEPVSWEPENYTPQIIQDLTDVYHVMRTNAPNTHIVLWSFANLDAAALTVVPEMKGVDYSHETVGFHYYTVTNLDEVHAKYPLFVTETCCDKEVNAISTLEQKHISWVDLAGKVGANELDTLLGVLNKAGYVWKADWEINP